jgi:hypothetical protein
MAIELKTVSPSCNNGLMFGRKCIFDVRSRVYAICPAAVAVYQEYHLRSEIECDVTNTSFSD